MSSGHRYLSLLPPAPALPPPALPLELVVTREFREPDMVSPEWVVPSPDPVPSCWTAAAAASCNCAFVALEPRALVLGSDELPDPEPPCSPLDSAALPESFLSVMASSLLDASLLVVLECC